MATAIPPCAYSVLDSSARDLVRTRTLARAANAIAALNPATPLPIIMKSVSGSMRGRRSQGFRDRMLTLCSCELAGSEPARSSPGPPLCAPRKAYIILYRLWNACGERQLRWCGWVTRQRAQATDEAH